MKSGMTLKYALGELCLIVVGVSIAMAASAWVQSRQDRADEQTFLARLHGDIELAEDLSERVRDRRIALLQSLIDASDVLHGEDRTRELSEAECNAIGGSSFFQIGLSELPAATELASTGRMRIIRNPELRLALVGMSQVQGAFPSLLDQVLGRSTPFFRDHPDLIQYENYIDPDSDEVRIRSRCDTAGMRADMTFLSRFAVNTDLFDVYLRDGLLPWVSHFDRVHDVVDEELGIDH
jgi:hypothetical protein